MRAEAQLAQLKTDSVVSKKQDKETDMPRDPRKHQKSLMKKRSKQKTALQRKSHRQASMPGSAEAILRHARTFPFLECRISDNWQKDDLGLVQILVARQQPDGNICFGVYLVDKFCLGLKNTFANAGFSRSRFENEVRNRIFHEPESVACPVELSHQMIHASIEY